MKRLEKQFPPLARPGQWGQYFSDRVGGLFSGRIVVEVGCFDGLFLAKIAELNPGCGFIGIDWTARSLARGAGHIQQRGIKNLVLVQDRGQSIADLFSTHEVDAIWVFHPEPCMREKERANRLIRPEFLIDAHAILRIKPESSLILKTDHPGYYQWTLGLLGLPEPEKFVQLRSGIILPRLPGQSKLPRRGDFLPMDQYPQSDPAACERFQVGFQSEDLWADPDAIKRVKQHDFGTEKTAYESRFVSKRRPIFYIEMVKRQSVRADGSDFAF